MRKTPVYSPYNSIVSGFFFDLVLVNLGFALVSYYIINFDPELGFERGRGQSTEGGASQARSPLTWPGLPRPQRVRRSSDSARPTVARAVATTPELRWSAAVQPQAPCRVNVFSLPSLPPASLCRAVAPSSHSFRRFSLLLCRTLQHL